MKQRKTTGLALGAACVLFCLVLISTHFTSGLYAKYVVNAGGKDGGRAASFHVDASMNSTGEAGSYGLSFTNDSESAVSYSITVQSKQAGMFASVTLGSKTETPDQNGVVTFSNVGALSPGGVGAAALTLIVDPTFPNPDIVPGAPDFSNDTVDSAETELPFTVTVTFVQID